ncbi:phage antirepressor [Brevibacillus centrosporus]|uniref:phage antirepressor n=1 Tax=Brevibacillus centrosporus TaxID=54910 RepID=UPI002E200705|nr:phage antirepressor KilAC domain-containing protein [Brevibacillus centrosporus]MED1953952.1 phage antirepressor KilAC domain-containing protein [Brevibacillus centrosporus]
MTKNPLKLFAYGAKEVRVVVKANDLWFVASDVTEILGIDRTQTRRLDEDEKGVCLIQTPGGQQEMLCVNEAGLYSLVLNSRKLEAKAFKRWVTHEVIPSVRKHGAYMTPETIEKTLNDPDFIIGLATKLKEEQQARRVLEVQIEATRPKVIFAEALETSNNTILIGELAKLLKQNGVDIGQNRLFERLRKDGYLGNKGEYYNLPTQKSMELKLFEIKTRSINNPDGSVRVTKTTKVTVKGQIYFINKLKSELMYV